MKRPNSDLRIMACCFCKEYPFQVWVKLQPSSLRIYNAAESDEVLAKKFILSQCGVGSRNDLYRMPEAAERFHERIRKPFLAWKESRK